jgi:hypothetical protein
MAWKGTPRRRTPARATRSGVPGLGESGPGLRNRDSQARTHASLATSAPGASTGNRRSAGSAQRLTGRETGGTPAGPATPRVAGPPRGRSGRAPATGGRRRRGTVSCTTGRPRRVSPSWVCSRGSSGDLRSPPASPPDQELLLDHLLERHKFSRVRPRILSVANAPATRVRRGTRSGGTGVYGRERTRLRCLAMSRVISQRRPSSCSMITLVSAQASG